MTVDQLVDSVYSQVRADKVTVAICASTVRVEKEGIKDCYIQKDSEEPDSLWKVFIQGNYYLGMETVNDSFRFAQFVSNNCKW